MTDKAIAYLQLAMYGDEVHDVAWDDHTGTSNVRVVWGAKLADDGITDVVFRGTTDLAALLMDLHALHTQDVPILGRVHPGFYDSMEWVWQAVRSNIPPPWRFSGHSLGAARASILTGLAVRDGKPPVARLGWGEPKSGFAELAKLIGSIPTRSYRNSSRAGGRHHDPVTDVPAYFPNYEYVHSATLIDICSPPTDKPEWDLLAWHSCQLYAEGTSECSPTPAACSGSEVTGVY